MGHTVSFAFRHVVNQCSGFGLRTHSKLRLLTMDVVNQCSEFGLRSHFKLRFPAPSSWKKDVVIKPVLGVWTSVTLQSFAFRHLPPGRRMSQSNQVLGVWTSGTFQGFAFRHLPPGRRLNQYLEFGLRAHFKALLSGTFFLEAAECRN